MAFSSKPGRACLILIPMLLHYMSLASLVVPIFSFPISIRAHLTYLMIMPLVYHSIPSRSISTILSGCLIEHDSDHTSPLCRIHNGNSLPGFQLMYRA
ncbi:hypothetical protein K402DRAFT_30787 [Aulographum hederae CBS 113979]|uniref:Uncharacterized protein n=1 Tax=Aulographum hederae CBS 113979 TaxID=1176131 RepID=A0A6G1H4W5_9PEZI|nr:hypothetical protein K402DRAFT_30787 [Aulographum hederae CBS 113979]